MSEPKDLLLVIEQLRRSNRRWKTLALTACFALALMVIGSFVGAARQRARAEAAMRAVNAALTRVDADLNRGQPR